MFFVKDYITTCFSIDDANKLQAVISPLIKQSDIIELDFKGVNIFTTLFFKYVLELGPDVYDKKISIINLSDVGRATYELSLENAQNYYLSESSKM